MKKSVLNIFIMVALISSCVNNKKYIIKYHENNLIEVEKNVDTNFLNIIKPYKDSIESQMNEILCYSINDLDKGKPQSTIGNFVVDLCLNYANADFCVMNNGGLRTTISKGNITLGNIYELMPFENELVVLELNQNEFSVLLEYIVKRGGEPFSGCKIVFDKITNTISHTWPKKFDINRKVKVLTSDYLANGGDNMEFFKNKKQNKVGIKLRDAIIDYCSIKDTINITIDERIIINE